MNQYSPESVIEVTRRFWSTVKIGDPGTCWEFTGRKDRYGYGRFTHLQREYTAHRVALAMTGKPVTEGVCVLHSCDNPACCNPAHLRVGTHQENMRDRDERGRAAAGPRNGRWKTGTYAGRKRASRALQAA